MNLYIGQKVKHKDLYEGKEEFEIIGIRVNEVELKGDYSGGTHPVTQISWVPKKGLILKNIWGEWVDPQTYIDFTKNAGPRDI